MTTTPTPAIAEGEPLRLEACPWGCPAKMHVSPSRPGIGGREQAFWVECDRPPESHSHIVQTQPYATEAEAIAAWNRRPSPEGRREVLEAADAVVKEWRHQSGRVFESMGSENPRAEAIDSKVEKLAAALQATPARTGEGPLEEPHPDDVKTAARLAHDMQYATFDWDDLDEEEREIWCEDTRVAFLAWSQVRGSLRTGEREAALEEAARVVESATVHSGFEDRFDVAAAIRALVTTPPPATPLDALGERAAELGRVIDFINTPYEYRDDAWDEWVVARRSDVKDLDGAYAIDVLATDICLDIIRCLERGDHLSTPTEKPPGGRT